FKGAVHLVPGRWCGGAARPVLDPVFHRAALAGVRGHHRRRRDAAGHEDIRHEQQIRRTRTDEGTCKKAGAENHPVKEQADFPAQEINKFFLKGKQVGLWKKCWMKFYRSWMWSMTAS